MAWHPMYKPHHLRPKWCWRLRTYKCSKNLELKQDLDLEILGKVISSLQKSQKILWVISVSNLKPTIHHTQLPYPKYL